jgi:hypothetical protein
VKDKNLKQYEVTNASYLDTGKDDEHTADLILKYARFQKEFKKRALRPEVYRSICFIKWRRSKLFIDPNIDLAALKPGWQHYHGFTL